MEAHLHNLTSAVSAKAMCPYKFIHVAPDRVLSNVSFQ